MSSDDGAPEDAPRKAVEPSLRVRFSLYPVLTFVTLYVYFIMVTIFLETDNNASVRIVCVGVVSAVTLAAFYTYRLSEMDFMRRQECNV